MPGLPFAQSPASRHWQTRLSSGPRGALECFDPSCVCSGTTGAMTSLAVLHERCPHSAHRSVRLYPQHMTGAVSL